MIHEFYVDNQLYLDFLEIKEEDIPVKNQKIDKQELYKIVEQSFRRLARKHHPDFSGTAEDFKKLVAYKKKLLEEDDGEANLSLKFDESKHISYDKNTLAARLGDQIFELISGWSDKLNIKPLSRPRDNADEYEWLFYINDLEEELCLNVQNMSNELMELSSQLYKNDALSVLVCLFIPSKKMTLKKMKYDNSSVIGFSDKIFIESSNAQDISNYFNDHTGVQSDLEKVKTGDFTTKENEELKVRKPKDTIERDRKILEYLQNIKLFSTEMDESAADFLDKL